MSRAAAKTMQWRIIDVLRTVCDPEIPVNNYDLGLICDLQISPDGVVWVVNHAHSRSMSPGLCSR